MARSLEITRPVKVRSIRMFMKEYPNPRIKERFQSIIWHANGEDCQDIAERLGRCRQVVSNYIKTYDRQGIEGLIRIGRGPGRQSQLGHKEKEKIRKWVSGSPRDIGLSFNSWDCKRLAILIEKEFNVRLSREQVRRMLHKMNFRLLRPRHQLLQANPELIAKKNDRFKGLWLPSVKIEALSSAMKTK